MPNYYRRFVESAERWPKNVALELQRQHGAPAGPGDRLTYAELRRLAEAVGAWLGQNAPPGARCALLANNSPRWVAAYLGALAAGCVAVPLDTAFKAEQAAKLLKDSGSSILFTDVRHLALAQKSVTGDTGIVLLDAPHATAADSRLKDLKSAAHAAVSPSAAGVPTLDQIAAAGARNFSVAEVANDDLAMLLYTSGTTSDPKGVMLTHGNLWAESEAVFKALRVYPTDALLGVLPLFHALAQMANLLLPLVAGARVVYLESLNTSELMRALSERDITIFACVPQFFYLIHERVLHQVEERGAFAKIVFSLLKRFTAAARKLGLNPGRVLFRRVHDALGRNMRFLVTGGSRFDPAVARDLYCMGFDILQAYGLTETSGGATVTLPNNNVLGSVGQPLPGGVEVRIVDPKPQSEGPPVGEIAMRGGIVMRGYYNRPDATAETLRDGWLHTGDLGYLDSRGNLFITGRQKDVIVLSSGKNIYPEEIEAHYQRSPFIKEITVMGLQGRPGEPFSERLHAVIVPDFDALRARKIVNAKEVIRYDIETLSAELPSTKRILSYEIWQKDLPRTTTRKLKRFAIQQEVVRGQAAQAAAAPAGPSAPGREFTEDDLAWLDDPEAARALAVVKSASNVKREVIHPDDSLELDLGLDSMERVELLVAVEEALDAKVEDSVAADVYTVRELVEAVRAGAGRKRADAAGWDSLLAADPPPEDVREFRPRPVATLFWYLAGRLVQVASRDLFKLRVSGLENLPREGPFIICPNHQSYLDPPVVASTIPWPVFRRIFVVGTSEIFGAGLFRKIAQTFRLFPVDPDRNLVPAMRIGACGLRRGGVLLIYPEGERSVDGAVRRFKKGAAILSAHLHVPIVPVAIDGFYDAWPRGKGFQKLAPLTIRYGPPVYPPEKIAADPEQTYQEVIGEVRKRVIAMWNDVHRAATPPRSDSADAAHTAAAGCPGIAAPRL